MKNKHRIPAEPSDSIDFLASSAVHLHGDALETQSMNPSAESRDSLRRVTTDEVKQLQRRTKHGRRQRRSGSSLRSRTGGIPGRAGSDEPEQSVHPDPAKHHRHRGFKIAGIITLVLILAIGLTAYLVWQNLMNKVNIINPTFETVPSEYNVPTEKLENPVPKEKGIQNILLMGVDSRDEEVLQSNSDTMMILTVDEITNTIKLTSLQRDMLVYEPGKKEPVRLNSVNTHGGPLLTMRVINETLRLNLTNYVLVNMSGMEAIIDIAGGVSVTVEQDEIYYTNQMIGYQNSIFPDTPASKLLSKAGKLLLNGRQAVAYARIRKLDSDYARMGRQRIVIQALLDRFMAANVGTKTNMISGGLPYITTNLSKTQLTGLGLTTVPMMKSTIEQMQLPITGYFKEFSGESWVNLCDFNGMIPLLQKFIYGRTYPFDPVKKIPGAPNSGMAAPTTRATTTARPSTTASSTHSTTTRTTTSTIPTTSTPPTTSTTSTESTAPTTEKTKPTKEPDPTPATDGTTVTPTTSSTTPKAISTSAAATTAALTAA